MSYLQLFAGMSLAGTLAVRFTSAGSSLWRRIWIPTTPEQLARSEENIFSVGGCVPLTQLPLQTN
jgi:hypothetical protein